MIGKEVMQLGSIKDPNS